MKLLTKRYLIFAMGLLLAADNLLLAQEAEEDAPETFAPQTTPPSPRAPSQETPGQAEKSAVFTETSPRETQPLMEIRRLDTQEPLYSFELRDVEIRDLFRVLAHDYKLNMLVDKEVSGRVSASLTNISLEEALDSIAESQNLKLEKKGNIIRASPHFITKVFNLKHIEARTLLEPADSAGSAAAPGSSGSDSAGQTGTIYDLLSEKGRVLLGAQPNSIIVIDYPPYVAKVEEYLEELDRKMDSRVFKLKYLKAGEVVGASSASSTASSDSTTATSAPSTGIPTAGSN